MKARISYMQLPLSVFMDRFPVVAETIPAYIDRNDPDYWVRFVPTSDGVLAHTLEVGYLSDAWMIH